MYTCNLYDLIAKTKKKRKIMYTTVNPSFDYAKYVVGYENIRHVKCNGSPLSLTENGTVFHKTDFLKKTWIFEKTLLCSKDFCKILTFCLLTAFL